MSIAVAILDPPPTTCEYCPLYDLHDRADRDYDSIRLRMLDESLLFIDDEHLSKRHENCPLVLVPGDKESLVSGLRNLHRPR